MLWHFLIVATHGTWITFIAVLFDKLLELFYRHRGSKSNIFISQPHTVSIMFITGEYGGHCMWWKGWFDIHATLFYQYEGVGAALSPWNTKKIAEAYEIYSEMTGDVLAHDIHIISWFRVPGISSRWQNDFFFSAICIGIHVTKYNCVFQWMLVHRDPKRAAIAPLTKGQSWTDFCV